MEFVAKLVGFEINVLVPVGDDNVVALVFDPLGNIRADESCNSCNANFHSSKQASKQANKQKNIYNIFFLFRIKIFV